MSETVVDTLSKLGLPALERLRDTYEARNDRQNAELVRSAIGKHGAVQTEELSNCGQLFQHRNYDPNTGRITHTYTGDCMAWLKDFTSQGASGSINYNLGTGANSPEAKARAAATVTTVLAPGERVQIVKA